MRSLAWLVLVAVAWRTPSTVRATESTSAQDHAVLDGALVLAGRHLYGRLPFSPASALHPMVSPEAEAWTVFDETGRGTRAFVYTRSRTFRCASVPSRDQSRCRLKLASVIVHEAWHLQHGRDEAGAYDAQLIFLQLTEASATLQLNQAAAVNIYEVRQAKARALRPRALSQAASIGPPAP